MVSEFQFQAPDDVLRMLDEILNFNEINKVKQHETSRHSSSNEIIRPEENLQ